MLEVWGFMVHWLIAQKWQKLWTFSVYTASNLQWVAAMRPFVSNCVCIIQQFLTWCRELKHTVIFHINSTCSNYLLRGRNTPMGKIKWNIGAKICTRSYVTILAATEVAGFQARPGSQILQESPAMLSYQQHWEAGSCARANNCQLRVAHILLQARQAM